MIVPGTKEWIRQEIIDQLECVIELAQSLRDDFAENRVTDPTLYGFCELEDACRSANALSEEWEEAKA